MVANGYGYSETPQTFNDKMKAAGGFQGEFVNAFLVPQVFPGISILSYDECDTSPAPVAKIDAALAKGDPVLVQVDWSPNAGVQSHWVIAYAKEGNDYAIYDPYMYAGDAPGKKLLMFSRYNHQGTDPATAISAALFLTGVGGQKSGSTGATVSGGSGSAAAPAATTTAAPAAPPAPKAKVPVPADSFSVYVIEDDLALRADPSVGGALISRQKLDTALKTLEKKTNAEVKVGQYNQWLQVQDPSGAQGYVAAWYVSKTKGASAPPVPGAGAQGAGTPAAPAASAVGAGELVVTPITDGLALREKPELNGNLIMRLPFTAKLKVLEAGAGARAKLGVTNQWLKVKEVTGKEGYVAAWYVTEAAAPALGVKAATSDGQGGAATPSSAIVVRTNADQVALRATPLVDANNLIKRYPLQAQLVLLDPAEAGKIGVTNQWLKVKDLDDQQGFVAAWYVAK
jgi:uncharacterized protein YgiM (DUF1202 family)